MDKTDWSEQFKGFFNTPLGQELIRSLTTDLHDNLIKKAQKSESMESAFGLIKEASGVMLAMEHMMFLSAVPKDEASRN